MSLPIAVLVSGSGSNLQSIIDRIAEGVLDAEIRLVVSNRAGAFGLERARKHNIPTKVLLHTDYPTREAFDAALVDSIHKAGVDKGGLVVMAGFMRIVTPVFLSAFPHRVVNIHPALLPAFPGVHGQADAADYGVKISGCTVHFVDEEMDHGPVIIQAAVPCQAGEDGNVLGPRILKLEHRVYPQAIQWIAEDRLTIRDRHVDLKVSGRPKAEQPRADIDTPTYALVWPPLEAGF
ncbi:MAG: phosphoribosylglycinamide formyltransferase [Pseudodesulfovibrio sp.]|uniref:Phosphoribosylglycinamide formyltransferase n=1 Tax=Pseudodesulfovibrio aespoeensis (strain ATCC 700646 / DSM 10631 / Aspo-2) TaxID=643562 RepID=E6VQN7_PSEA9|nr:MULTISPECIES: phosphoribosylglycinamide formyltransferase [Pseudodesulfovibrio]MBU4192082.1 phosphoribosylglycinamide formyltransferase [Pseudomonadota bacterium]ADU61764.1 phosphoribosylglycinamide formyltransferase [Pseudodesulfovibrio aespoeensis Aspo-2]MBU4243037.1 phosphoribosylglycinamide formyltransferase [Pseudomonadota bacterium]MBU4378272.1 phosphoribosylglycinamide formyltransferase [Pseudomonadota bacterium]MBU4475824.1 phosphoribosylglycinamide formyltransferase [Pseudomonadota